MTQKRKVGPGGGDFALNPNRFSGVNAGGGRITKRKRLKPETEKKLKAKAKKVGRKVEKKKATPPFAKQESALARKGDPDTPLKKGLKAGEDLKREKDFMKGIEDRVSKRMRQRKPGQPGEGKPRSKRRKDVTKIDRRSIKLTDESAKKASKEISENVKKATKDLKQRKRKRELKEDAKRRRN